MFYFLFMAVFITGLLISRDWLIYKHRGQAQPDDPTDPNPPVVTGPEDARAQRLLDLSRKKSSKDRDR